MRQPTESLCRIVKDNGSFGKTVRKYSYVVTLCKVDSYEVCAVRIEYYANKEEVHKAIKDQYPGWKVKTISRLYDEDFME